MALLISSVMCGITWTVEPRYSPRRSLVMTDSKSSTSIGTMSPFQHARSM